ncbi:hypothetical protein ABBQ32_000458 [Trebouxia sp. C0010 RCD-2024]
MPSLLHLSSACNASASQSKICFLVTRFLVLPRGIVSVSALRLVGRPWHWGQGQAQQKIVHIFSQAMQGAHNTCVVQQQHILTRPCKKNIVPAVLAALRRMPATKPQHRQALAIWLRASKELEAHQQARLKANEPSARQQRGYVDFREVIKVCTSLAKGSR